MKLDELCAAYVAAVERAANLERESEELVLLARAHDERERELQTEWSRAARELIELSEQVPERLQQPIDAEEARALLASYASARERVLGLQREMRALQAARTERSARADEQLEQRARVTRERAELGNQIAKHMHADVSGLLGPAVRDVAPVEAPAAE